MNSGWKLQEVGLLKPNAWGLYDMSGNAWEWCEDWFLGAYSQDEQIDPKGPTVAFERVYRGGNYGSFPHFCRSANRGSGMPDSGDAHIGFRVVRVLPKDQTTTSSLSEIIPAAPARTGEKVAKVVDGILTNTLGMQLKYIPAGSFQMGAPDSEKFGKENEGPLHKVTLTKPFYMGVYEVTQEQYEEVMGENPSKTIGRKKPIERITWGDAQTFCKKLSEIEKQEYRLPTEAEWEYACRAGTQTMFYWGEKFDENALWYIKSSGDKLQDIGMLKPNPWGLYDMMGNVAEWCGDWAADYPKNGEQTDPTGPVSGSERVLRGGGFWAVPAGSRSAARYFAPPDGRGSGVGFRVVAVPVAGQ